MKGDLSPRILRAGNRPAVRWKNDGGLTREVAVHPPGSDLNGFDWRVSIAEVHAGGAFSSFVGVNRHLAVLEGCLSLAINGQDAISLSTDSAPVWFAGDVAAFAEPLGQAVTDLNVMTRRGRFDSQMTKCTAPASLRLGLQPGTAIIVALSELRLRCHGTESGLSKLDAALIEGAGQCEVVSRAAHAFYLIELSAVTRTR